MPNSPYHIQTSVTRGTLRVVDNNNHPGCASEVKFQFNPTKLEITAKGKVDQPRQGGGSPGGGAARVQWVGSLARTMTLDLQLDAWEDHDGQAYDLLKTIKTLVAWTKPTPQSTTKEKPNPPQVMLSWGEARQIIEGVPEYFKMFLTQVKYTYTMFDELGTPMRATVNIQGQEIPDPRAKTNPTSGSMAGRQSHVVLEGDTLASVAYKYYGVPRYWRGLAQVNRIDDPLRVRPGTSLYVPPLSEVAEQS